VNVLGIDTSTPLGSVALVTDGVPLSEQTARVRARHGETLMPLVERALELSGISLAEVDLLAVGLGPGSFTGLRVGIATAQGLALASDLPVVGVGSLEALAFGLGSGAAPRVPLLDAHKGEVYAAAYRAGASDVLELFAPFHAPPAEAAERLRRELGAVSSEVGSGEAGSDEAASGEATSSEAASSAASSGEAASSASSSSASSSSEASPGASSSSAAGPALIACGDGARRYEDTFASAFGAGWTLAPPLFDGPRAAALAVLAATRFAAGAPTDPAELEPRYVRASDAKLPQ
jgi:tRNA threonylcarbamoyladenosine biosynthesis protein TsaB